MAAGCSDDHDRILLVTIAMKRTSAGQGLSQTAPGRPGSSPASRSGGSLADHCDCAGHGKRRHGTKWYNIHELVSAGYRDGDHITRGQVVDCGGHAIVRSAHGHGEVAETRGFPRHIAGHNSV